MNTDTFIMTGAKNEYQIHIENRKKVAATLVETSSLTPIETERMYAIFSKYYSNHNQETFLTDLFEKNHVILLRDASDKTIRGFSTLLKVTLNSGGQKAIGIFSGDTVLEKEYWGTTALGVAFLRYLWMEKIKSPFKPVYWFLISKGYKTYLLMANNFKTFYPRYDQATPEKYKTLMDFFYGERFSTAYNPQTGVIEMESSACRLKEKVAEITPSLLNNPKILFFADKNPGWGKGFELCCISKMTLSMPFTYVLRKALQKKGQK